MCIKSDYDKWKNGEFVWDRYGRELIPITPEIQASLDEDEREYFTYEQFGDYDYIDYEYNTNKNYVIVDSANKVKQFNCDEICVLDKIGNDD